MATSESTDFSATASDAITEALELIGELESGETPNAADQASCLRTLNLLLKQWSGNFDFAPGLKLFNRKRGYLFTQQGQSAYRLGPSGDNATLSYVTTTMRISGVASDTTLEVTSTAGMTAADKIGIVLDSGAIQWTTISSVTDADTLVIASGLSSSVAAGNRIFTYTTKLMRPLYIESASLRDSSGVDSPMYPMDLEYYEYITTKSDDQDATHYHYENSLTNGTLQLDYEPADVTKIVRLVFMAPAEDIDAVSDDLAFPQEWLAPIAIGLAKRISPKFGPNTWTQALEAQYVESLAIARSAYAETTDAYFQPGLE